MDLQFFINVLLKRKWLILASMLIAGAAAYFFVNMQDEKYKSYAIISTGIMGAEGLNTDREIPFFQQFQIEMSINNLTEFIQSRKNINLLSFHLLLHDLEKPEGQAFRQMEVDEENPLNYSQTQVDALVDAMRLKSDSLNAYLEDPILEPIYKNLSIAYGYDYESILEDLIVGRKNTESDLLNIEYESEDPELCSFVVNTFCDIVLQNHRELRRKEDKGRVEFYKALSDSKKKEMDERRNSLRFFKETGSLLDIDNQKESTITQIKDLELKQEEYLQRRDAALRNVKDLGVYLDQYNGGPGGSDETSKILSSRTIVQLQEKIKTINDAYIESGLKDNKLRIQKEAFEQQLKTQLKLHAESRKGKKLDQDGSEENILNKKIEAELELNFTEEAITSINVELNRLRGKSIALVSKDASVKNMESEIDVISTEYVELKKELNQANINLQNVADQLNLLEHAQTPDKPESSKKPIIAAFSGIVAGTMTTFLIFILAYFDRSLSTPSQFEKYVDLDILGKMNKVKTKGLDLNHLYNSNGKVKSLDYFRESMRNMRYMVESSKACTFLFTSTKSDEGKTFTMLNLAHSLQLKNKKVVLLDTNFKKNTLTQLAEESGEVNLELQKLIVEHQLADVFGIKQINGLFNIQNLDVIVNSGNYMSPSEILAGKDFHTFLDKLTLQYDYIFFEAPSMNRYSDTKELTDYAEKVIAVFSADSDSKPEDQESLDFLKGLGNKFMGAVLNKIDLKNVN